jgi:hypothetical protein
MKIDFWVTNISKSNVTLSDLNITIPARSSVNLLDEKHYYLTLDQLNNSYIKGSIFKKRDKIFLRKIPPITKENNNTKVREDIIPDRTKSIFEIPKEQYEELNIEEGNFGLGYLLLDENNKKDVK